MKNAPATLQRLINRITNGLEGCGSYIDDLIIYSDTWDEHLCRLKALLGRLSRANLVTNLSKCEFVKARVQYLGFVVGYGKVAQPTAKGDAICKFPVPTTKKKLQRYLGMIGYYRKFILNLSDVVAPLTELLKKGVKYEWNQKYESAFCKVKAILSNRPVLQAPDFSKPFKIAVDASNIGADAVLL